MRTRQKKLSENVRKTDVKTHRVTNKSSELTSEEVFQEVGFANETDEKKSISTYCRGTFGDGPVD